MLTNEVDSDIGDGNRGWIRSRSKLDDPASVRTDEASYSELEECESRTNERTFCCRSLRKRPLKSTAVLYVRQNLVEGDRNCSLAWG